MIVGVTAAAAATARAQDPPAIGETELVARIEAHPRVEAAAARVDAARAEETAAATLPNPEVTYQREEVFPDEGGGLADQLALLSWTIDVSGRRGKRVAAARAGTKAAQAEAERDRIELLADALDVYDEAAFRRARTAVVRDGRDALAAAVDSMRRRATAGDVAGYDADRLALELAALDDAIADADVDLAAAERALARVAGAAEDRLAAADPPALPPPPPALAGLLDAIDARPDLRAARLRAEQASHSISAAGRGWIPSLSLVGGLKTSDLGGETATGYVAAISLELPLFDRAQGDRARAAAARRLAVAEARLLEREIPSRVRDAHAALVARIAQARAYQEKQGALAVDLVKRAETAYREGERPIVELVDAYRTARETRIRALELVREARRAERSLWRAMGRRP
jgi:cobalt-zinc-cadmium efflux system outer membrane protein